MSAENSRWERGKPATLERLSEMQRFLADAQVLVGRDDVDVAGLDARVIVRFEHGELWCAYPAVRQ